MDQLFQEKPQTISKQPGWCSNDMWANLSRAEFEFVFSRAEKKILRKRKPIKVSEWSEKHRIVTMSRLPGIWKNSVTPYLASIMDAAALPFVREIIVCKTPQTGVSEAAHNFIGYCIDRDPGPVLYVYPDEKTAGENSKDRILPMIKSSPRLRTYLTGTEKDASTLRINMQHMPIYLGWGRSVASIANKPIKIAISDEVDKPGFDPGKKESPPLDLIDDRLITFRETSTHWKISTPTVESGNIWRELNENTDVIFDYHVKCPLCNNVQLMEFRGIHWDGGSKADIKVIKNKKLAWYECNFCPGKWDDVSRDMAVRGGVWRDRLTGLSIDAYLERLRPANIGFHIPSWISYFVSLSEVVVAFLKGNEDPEKLQKFKNSYEGLPWKNIIIKHDEEEILDHKNHLPAGVVPQDAVALTCGIDVQKHGFWFVVRSWTRDMSNHLVQYGFLSTWKDVENLVFNTTYPVEAKENVQMGIWRAAIDTGGGKSESDEWTKTEEIYEWVRINNRDTVFAIKGASNPQLKKVVPRVIDKMTKGNRVIEGGLVIFFLDTSKFKDLYHWRLGRSPEESQTTTLNSDTGIDYAKQILAVQKQTDKQKKVEWVQIRRDDHLFDCEVYASACADPEWSPSLQFMARQAPSSNQRRIISRGIDGNK
ncbi:MAG: phage terminase large subunit family protein [Desulfobacterales bacterium]|nr:phage terminase large subunit family protein [Desulfobacterales bacterium]